jgi:hypothetical protein
MSDAIITVETLSKKYLVGHKAGDQGRYTALRDVIGREARSVARKAIDVGGRLLTATKWRRFRRSRTQAARLIIG